jgi:hypothetical protein
VTSSNPAVYGTNLSLVVVVQPSYSGVPSGPVTLWDGTQSIASANLNASGQATFSLRSLTQGAHALSAQYAGDANFAGSNSATLSQSVLYPSAVTISSSAAPVLVGSTVTFVATVNSQYGVPTGAVIFLDGSRVLGQTNATGGIAPLSVPGLKQGMHSIQAAYQGDGTFIAASSSVLNQGISDFSITASLSSLSLSAGASGTDQLNIIPLTGFSGTVAFTCGAAPALATCTVSPSSVLVNGTAATATVSITTAGPMASAVYGGGAGARTALMGILFSSLIGVFGLSRVSGGRSAGVYSASHQPLPCSH